MEADPPGAATTPETARARAGRPTLGDRRPRVARLLAWTFLAACALLGAKRIAWQTRALAVVEPYPAAVDLKLRYAETQGWWDGRPVYGERRDADYPPASYVMFWPFLRPWSLPTARALWCAVNLVALAALSWIFARAVPAEPRRRVLAGLLPFFATPSAATIGAGQVGLVVLAATLAAILLAEHAGRRATRLPSAALAWLGLAKPSVTVPLTLALLGSTPGWWAAVLSGAAYAGATAAACAAQPVALRECLGGWIRQGLGFADMGYGNLATWANAAGHPRWILPLAAAAFAGAATWLWRHRRAGLWTKLGVLGCVARLWTYHNPVDDLLIYLPIVALLGARQSPRQQALADGLAGAAVVCLLLPTRLIQDDRFETTFLVAMVGIELAMLATLLRRGSVEHRAAGGGLALPPRATR